jgi:hypothetical protein
MGNGYKNFPISIPVGTRLPHPRPLMEEFSGRIGDRVPIAISTYHISHSLF